MVSKIIISMLIQVSDLNMPLVKLQAEKICDTSEDRLDIKLISMQKLNGEQIQIKWECK